MQWTRTLRNVSGPAPRAAAAPLVVSRWSRTFARPRLVVSASCTPDVLVGELLVGLSSSGFRQVSRHDLAGGEAGSVVRVRRVDWLAWLTLLGAESCVMELRVVPASGGALANVVVTNTGVHPAPVRAAAGLSEAIVALRASGVDVTVADWEPSRR